MFRTAWTLLVFVLCQSAIAAEPSAVTPEIGDPAVVGMYRVTSAEGPETAPNWRGFAAITQSCGIISNHDGTAPIFFRFITAKQRGQNLIDLWTPGDSERNVIYGIYEISEDTVKLCLANQGINSAYGRPKSFDEADPKLVAKLVLKRVPLDEVENTGRSNEK